MVMIVPSFPSLQERTRAPIARTVFVIEALI